MELNADFSQRVVVHTARMPWVASPIAGVERRMLDRIGDEVAQVLRRHAASGRIEPAQGRAALNDLNDFPLDRYPHDLFLPRVWELRHNLTAYDAVYVALAEALDAPLLTCDRRLAAASGHRARIELV